MSVPLTVQLINAFLGTEENIHSVILPDIFSSGGSKNVWIDKYGRAKRILGYAKQNSSAVVTNTGGSATMVRALFPYRKTSGGSVTRQLLGFFDDTNDEFELWRSTDDGVNWTFTVDLGAGSVGSIPDFGQQGDTLIITNGKVAPRKWDGTTLTTAGATQSPQPSASAGSTGNLKGNYQWKLLSVIAGVRKAGSLASTNLALDRKRGSLSWTADADTNVTGYELYRTTGTGAVYYFVDYIDGRTTVAYVDNFEDIAILENRVMEEHGDAPPVAYYAVPHKQRMWYLRTDAEPQIGYWSDPGDPESVLSDNNLQFADAETQGDFITGGVGDFEGQLIVFEEHAIWSVNGTGQIIGNIQDWTRIRTNAKVGSVSHRTAARIPAGSRYVDQEGQVQSTSVVTLAYLTPLLDIRIFDGDNDVVISHPVATSLSTLNFAHRIKSFALHDTTRSEVAWLYPDGVNTEPSTAVVWNYRWGVWYRREWAFGHAIEQDSSSTAAMLLAGAPTLAVTGFVYKLWTGNSAAGANFRAQWMSKTLYGQNDKGSPALSNTKRWRWADFRFQTESLVTLNLEWVQGDAPDNASALGTQMISPAAQVVLSANGNPILSIDGNPITVSSDTTAAKVLLRTSTQDYLHDLGIRVRIYDDAQAASWSLEALNLAYQILPGLKHRDPV